MFAKDVESPCKQTLESQSISALKDSCSWYCPAQVGQGVHHTGVWQGSEGDARPDVLPIEEICLLSAQLRVTAPTEVRRDQGLQILGASLSLAGVTQGFAALLLIIIKEASLSV